MQQLTKSLKDAIRSGYQIPMAKVEIYDKFGALIGVIPDIAKVSIDVAKSRKVRRIFSVELDNRDFQYTPDPDQYDRNLLWYNKTCKVYFGFKTGPNNQREEWLPQGEYTIDNIDTDYDPDGSLIRIDGQDLTSRMIEDKFDDVYTVIDGTATESANYALATEGALVSSTTFVAAGDEIQAQGRIHYVDHFATINGISRKVENQYAGDASDPRRMLDGDDLTGYRFTYRPDPDETVSQIEAEIFFDLQSAENVQQIVIDLIDGTLTDYVWISPDNQAWQSYDTTTITPNGPVRFVKFKVRKTTAQPDGSFTLAVTDIRVKTAEEFGPVLAVDGDLYGTHWRPKTTDPDPHIDIDFGAVKTINVLYLFWGGDSFDFWNRVQYYVEYSTDAQSWQRIPDLNGLDETRSLYGDVEHAFDDIQARWIRIYVKRRDGVCKLRHVLAQRITAARYVDKALTDLFTSAGITKVRFPRTRRYITGMMAEIGKEKYDFACELAASANWIDPEMAEDGYIISGPRDIDPVNVAWDFHVETDNIFKFSPSFSNDIYNVILVVYKSSDQKAIVGKAIDDNPLSPTYAGPGGLGRKVMKYENSYLNTQEKVDRYAQEKLFEKTRYKHRTTLPITGHPALQHDDVVTVTIPGAVESVYYLVTGYVTDFEAEAFTFDTRINISQI